MNTRKKVIKTVYRDEDDSEAESGAGDFSDSGSDAKISDVEQDSSDEDAASDGSGEDFDDRSNKTYTISSKPKHARKAKFAKNFIKQIVKQNSIEYDDSSQTPFSVKDLTEADKLLPSVLNLSESDSSDDEDPKPAIKKHNLISPVAGRNDSDSEDEPPREGQHVWSKNIKDNSEEVAKQTFMELEQHKSAIEETKASILNYESKCTKNGDFDVKDLLAQGEEVIAEPSQMKKKKGRRAKDDSDSEMEDWEEVNDVKPIPKQGLELKLDFPDGPVRKTKKLDIEMMMKRKLNRVKKEYQVYMHKVHVLCWLGHGNFVSRVLNDQDIMAAALSLVPSKECYPGERVDMKYVEQITTWYRDKLTLKLDKNEEKFRPKAPPLKEILLAQMKGRVVSAKKNLVFIFVSMLRALGLQCRVMFNFVTLPIKPPASELCSLSIKQKDEKASDNAKAKDVKKQCKGNGKTTKSSLKVKNTGKISQVDGADDDTSSSDDDYQNVAQLDGNDDLPTKSKSTRTRGQKDAVNIKVTTQTDDIIVTVESRNARAVVKKSALKNVDDDKDVSPPKKARRGPSSNAANLEKPEAPLRKTRRSVSSEPATQKVVPARRPRKSVSPKPMSSTAANLEKPKAPLRKSRSVSAEPDTQKVVPARRPRKSVSPKAMSSTAANLEKPEAPLRKSRKSVSAEPDTQKVVPARRPRKSVSPKPMSSTAANLEKPKAPLRKSRSVSAEPDTQKVVPARRPRKSVSPKAMSSTAANLEKPEAPLRKSRKSVSAEPNTQKVVPARRPRKSVSLKSMSSSATNLEKPKAPLRKTRRSVSAEPDTQKVLPARRPRKSVTPKPMSSSPANLENPEAPLRKTRRSVSPEPATQKVVPARRPRKSVSPKPNLQDEAPPPRKIRRCVTPKSDQESLPKKASSSRKITHSKLNSAAAKPKSRNSRSSSKSVEIKQDTDSSKPKRSRTRPENASAAKDTTEKSGVIKQSTKTCNAENKPTTSKVNNLPKLQSAKNIPKIVVTNDSSCPVESKYFEDQKTVKKLSLSRKRSQIATLTSEDKVDVKKKVDTKRRSKSNPAAEVEQSKYFDEPSPEHNPRNSRQPRKTTKKDIPEDTQRVSHRDLLSKSKAKPKNDVTGDLVNIIKSRVKQSKEESKIGVVKGKLKQESDEDSDYMPEASPKRHGSESDDDFKPTKLTPKPRASTSTSTSGRKVDRRVLSSDDDTPKNKCDVWCEVFVEELEQWISVDVVKGKVHCESDIYKSSTHPVCYIVGWDNNNYLKDVTRRYVPHWNTVTRKQRAEPAWWDNAVRPWQGPKTAKDREEDEQLNRMQLEAPLPTSIGEYKNHPLYALTRHLLKFEAIYPPDAAVLGFVRKEPVYARECVYVCRSRDTWLKEAKVVRLGETPYKVVKARPKWDRLSNKLITDKPLEVFGPWQVDDYEPPTAVDGVVPRNAYGNVELFKECMLPKGTAHVKLPGLNRVAKKLNIDCAPAMTGFDFNGGWSHPVYDGFVVCKEFEEIITQAWLEDQEEQERKELEKLETRVYGNWRRFIKGLLIRQRVNTKYGFDNPPPAPAQGKKKAPRFVAKKK